MARPALKVEIGFGATWQTASPTWTDVTGWLVGDVEWSSGRSRDSTSLTAGTARLQLRNRDDRFTPTNSAGAYSPNVKPLVPVRITATWSSASYDCWRGLVREWQPQWDNPSNPVCVLDCVDAFRVFGDREIVSQYADAVLALAPTYLLRCGADPRAAGSQILDATGHGFGGYLFGTSEPGSGQSVIAGDSDGSANFGTSGNDYGVVTGTSLAGGQISGTENFSVAVWWDGDSADMTGGTSNERKFFQQSASGSSYVYVAMDTTTGKIKFVIYDGTAQTLTSTSTFSSAGGPTMVAATRSGSSLALYVNGAAEATLTSAAKSVTVSQHGWGGHPAFAAAQSLRGRVDECAFWKGTALTSGQISTLYQSGLGYRDDTPARRVVRVLDAIGWPGTGLYSGTGRQIDQRSTARPGPRMREWPAPATVLSLLQDAVDADDGDCVIDRAGRVRFIDAHGLPTSIDDQVLASYTAGYWRLDETSGTTATDSHVWPHAGLDALWSYVQKNGTYTGSPTLNQASLVDFDSTQKSVDFNGTTQYVTVSNAAQFQYTTAFTLAGIVRLDTFTTENPIVAKSDAAGRDWWLIVDTAGKARCGLRTSGGVTYEVTSTVVMTAGNTYAVLGWYSDTDNLIGVSVNGTATTAAVAGAVSAGTSTRPVEIGRRHDGTAYRYLDGRASHVWVSQFASPGDVRGGAGWQNCVHVAQTFDDQSVSAPYVSAQTAYAESTIANRFIGAYPDSTGIGANQPLVEDTASITAYGLRPVDVAPNLTEIGEYYGWLWVPAYRGRSRWSQPRLAVTRLELDGHLAAASLWPTLLSFELGTRTVVVRHPYSGFVLGSVGFARSVSHRVDDGDEWSTVIEFAQ